MPGMINYIFKSIHVNEDAIENVKKVLRNQANLNRTVTLFAVMTAAYIYVQDKQIRKLTEEVKELKRAEGE